jgi:probable rRNA maturation factor
MELRKKSIRVKITLFNSQRKFSLPLLSIRRSVKFFLDKQRVNTDEVIIHFVGKKKICLLHKEFFEDASLTDCISFPIDPPKKGAAYSILGEIFVCPEVAYQYALEHDREFAEELCLYVLHGLLHLLGYDDLDKKERQKMRRAEKHWLTQFKSAGLLK